MKAARGALLILLTIAPAQVWAAAKGSDTFLPGGNTKEPVSITAAKLDYFDKERKLIYSGGVNAVQGDSRIKCSTMTIYLTKDDTAEAAPAAEGAAAKPGGPAVDNNSVDKVECAGPVTVVSKCDVGTGDNGLYEKGANKFYINGHVALSQGPNVTTGDKLAYDIGTAKAIVTGGVRSLFVPGNGSKTAKPCAK